MVAIDMKRLETIYRENGKDAVIAHLRDYVSKQEDSLKAITYDSRKEAQDNFTRGSVFAGEQFINVLKSLL